MIRFEVNGSTSSRSNFNPKGKNMSSDILDYFGDIAQTILDSVYSLFAAIINLP